MLTREVQASTAVAAPGAPRIPTNRLVSVDVLRGITIAFMILVNNGFSNYAFPALEHAEWNGWTPTDLVFPTFLFLVGVTIVFSFESRLSRGASRSSLLLHTFRRAAILFALGLVVNGFPYFHLETLRIYGVLQRIAICFLIASILYLLDRRPTSKIVVIVVALFGYWILLRWVPVPGFGMPGRDIPLFDPTRNLGAYIDRHIFPGRLYRGVRDPEGLLSDIPAVATTLLGMLTAMWLRCKRSPSIKAWGMLAAGILGIILGQVWNLWFPINKNLWTSSYVLFAAGIALVALSICYWAVDIKNWKTGWTYIWLVFGMNAITVYVFSELLAATLYAIKVHSGTTIISLSAYLFDHCFSGIPSHHLASLAYSITIVAICFIPVAILYRQKIFLKV
ncbi:MAG TPA: heparan-alpha-glucosaminide N-acetyltransferase domain-containing protein [Acidobacteriaceae bacterium]|nr:heparan-alpha-glucosaminide N-acetyltransferase domain-containing protein [Acidobacteriaceae bacterium]